MNIQVRGDHVEVTKALSDYIEKKIGRLERYFDSPPERDVSVTLSIERGIHRVEVALQIHGIIFRAEERSGDMYASIDLVTDKVEHQLHKHKEKLNKQFRAKGLRTRIQASTENGAFRSWPDAESPERQLVRVKTFPMKPMDVEEAMLQLELLGHDFYMFANAVTDEVNVIYRRKDGQYGLIEPQA